MNTEVKEKVRTYIDQIEGEFFPDDISRKLDVDFQEVMNICQELINDGKIEIVSWRADTLKNVPGKVVSE